MSQQLIKKIEDKYNKNRPEVNVGDSVVVSTIIRDGDKKRIQKFKGLVIAIQGKGVTKTFTVRKISYGVGVEKTFPINSENISEIEVLKHSTVRKSKLYYLRNRVGKAAMKLKDGQEMIVDEAPIEEVNEAAEEVTMSEDTSK